LIIIPPSIGPFEPEANIINWSAISNEEALTIAPFTIKSPPIVVLPVTVKVDPIVTLLGNPICNWLFVTVVSISPAVPTNDAVSVVKLIVVAPVSPES
jgi:hypothetical protein